ncbi:MAG: TetR family transcriptional regulator [Gammaproteobacteria bacterium]|nr:TetR family transcriptional regulator [Gammaproteobacteria bacterium]
MARRSDHTREELRALINDATSGLVGERGPEGVTARLIAERIGYAAGTL